MTSINKYQLAIYKADTLDPGNKWVTQMKIFYENNGYLSHKQMDSLENLTVRLDTLKAYEGKSYVNNYYEDLPDWPAYLDILSDHVVYDRGGRKKLNILKDIASGLINPSLEDLCAFEELEEAKHEDLRESYLISHNEDIGDYESSLDMNDFH